MIKYDVITTAQRQLFRNAIKSLVHHNHVDSYHDSSYSLSQSRQLRPLPLDCDYHLAAPKTAITGHQNLLFYQPSIQKRVIKKLQKGLYVPQNNLDLHGQNAKEAYITLHQFLNKAKQKNYHCIRIIHGKGLSNPNGQAIIKSYVNDWLRQYPSVLAFCSAPAQQGGTGAVYVLLKRSHLDNKRVARINEILTK